MYKGNTPISAPFAGIDAGKKSVINITFQIILCVGRIFGCFPAKSTKLKSKINTITTTYESSIRWRIYSACLLLSCAVFAFEINLVTWRINSYANWTQLVLRNGMGTAYFLVDILQPLILFIYSSNLISIANYLSCFDPKIWRCTYSFFIIILAICVLLVAKLVLITCHLADIEGFEDFGCALLCALHSNSHGLILLGFKDFVDTIARFAGLCFVLTSSILLSEYYAGFCEWVGKRVGNIACISKLHGLECLNEVVAKHEELKRIFHQFNVVGGSYLLVKLFSCSISLVFGVYSVVASIFTRETVSHATVDFVLLALAIWVGNRMNLKMVKSKEKLKSFYLLFEIKEGTSSEQLSCKSSKVVMAILDWQWKFSAFGVFTIDYSLIPGIIGTMMTYVLLTIQLKIAGQVESS